MRLQVHIRERRCASTAVSVRRGRRRRHSATTLRTPNARDCWAERGGAISQAELLLHARERAAGPGEDVEGMVNGVVIGVEGMANGVVIGVDGMVNGVVIGVEGMVNGVVIGVEEMVNGVMIDVEGMATGVAADVAACKR